MIVSKRILATLTLVMALCSQALGQVVREDVTVSPRDLAVLSIPKTGGDVVVVWSFLQPLDRRFESFQTADAHKCVFVSGELNEKLIVEASLIDWDQRRFEKRIWVVTSVKGTPPPNPDPNPPPDPDPDPDPPPPLPEGFVGLTKLSHDLVVNVPEPQRSRYRPTIAENFREASKLTLAPAAMLERLRFLNGSTLPEGPERESWRGWFTPWSAHVEEMQRTSKMGVTTADYQKAFAATADGLEWGQ